MNPKIFCYAAIFFSGIMMLATNAQTQERDSASIRLLTTDLDNNIKTTFNPEDRIRYVVSWEKKTVRFVAARGAVKFSGNSSERLELQFKRGPIVSSVIYWDSLIPASALGTATVSVFYFSIPGGFGSSSASFTVEERQPLPQANYIGRSLCIACHWAVSPDAVDAYVDSGHNFALNVVNATAPVYPSFAPGVSETPTMFRWNDILYVVGGYAWKANYVKSNGSFITNGVDGIDAQFNLPNTFLKSQGEFVSYEADQTVQKPFTCGPCHTTGFSPAGNQNNLPGLKGTWKEEGVGCEACHGPGSNHVANPRNISLPDDPATACVNCHFRNNNKIVEAENGLVLHQQQSEELAAGAKFYFKCVSCHDPHASAHYSSTVGRPVIIQECTDCHKNVTVGLGMQFLRCIDCHMPYAVKSGAYISYNDPDRNNLKAGDIRSHLFTINIEAQSPADMFSPDGRSLSVGNDGRAKGLTLDFVCLSCHRQGGLAVTSYTFNQAKSLAEAVHPK